VTRYVRNLPAYQAGCTNGLVDFVFPFRQIVKIEGVFSGTLSYIFNEFSPVSGAERSFSSVVQMAKQQGYTEPHPADDLSGADVARKLTILSRLIPELANNLPEGYKSVSITSLIPQKLQSEGLGANGDEFVERLKVFDGEYEALQKKAVSEGNVLRFVGVVDVPKGIIKAALQPYVFSLKPYRTGIHPAVFTRYPRTHPFATSLSGSDNIIAFHTERYGARPLIVQGAGAGAAVTAMGVLSDLFKL
jgi:homoserine dehydrogenase